MFEEKTDKIIKILCPILTIIFGVLFIIAFFPNAKEVYNEHFFSKADSSLTNQVKIVEIIDEYEEKSYFGDDATYYVFRCKVLKSEELEVGSEILVLQCISENDDNRYIPGQKGNIIYISKITSWTLTGEYDVDWEFIGSSFSFDRVKVTIILVIIFVLLIILFSKIQGVYTIIALALSIVSIFIVFIPKVLLGGNIYFWTFVISLYIIIVTLLLVIGVNWKALSAFIGCIGGVIIIAILTLIIQKVFALTGNYDETTYELDLLVKDSYSITLDLRSLIFASITLGSIGALLDVAISLSSSLYEVSLKGAMGKEIIVSGFTIGKDMLGTMTNTLILAYLGSSLPVVLYTILFYNLEMILRLEMISIELVQSIIGTIGMLSAIPIVSIFCGFIYMKKKPIIKIEEN